MRKAIAVVVLLGLVSSFAVAENCAVSSYFASPHQDGEIRDIILDLIEDAITIQIAMYSFTDDLITDALIAAYQSGTKISIIADNTQAAGVGSDIQRLADAGI